MSYDLLKAEDKCDTHIINHHLIDIPRMIVKINLIEFHAIMKRWNHLHIPHFNNPKLIDINDSKILILFYIISFILFRISFIWIMLITIYSNKYHYIKW